VKILIADDEKNILTPYKIILESDGHQVQISEDGQQCMDIYKREFEKMKPDDETPFDVVILDYRMPKKDGLACATEILDMCESQRIIFASAFIREMVQKTNPVLVNEMEFLQKPFELDTLVSKVNGSDVYDQLATDYSLRLAKNAKPPRYKEIKQLLDSLNKLQKKYLD